VAQTICELKLETCSLLPQPLALHFAEPNDLREETSRDGSQLSVDSKRRTPEAPGFRGPSLKSPRSLHRVSPTSSLSESRALGAAIVRSMSAAASKRVRCSFRKSVPLPFMHLRPPSLQMSRLCASCHGTRDAPRAAGARLHQGDRRLRACRLREPQAATFKAAAGPLDGASRNSDLRSPLYAAGV
jgi:hypothetical protein